jgi:hypothetical protein
LLHLEFQGSGARCARTAHQLCWPCAVGVGTALYASPNQRGWRGRAGRIATAIVVALVATTFMPDDWIDAISTNAEPLGPLVPNTISRPRRVTIMCDGGSTTSTNTLYSLALVCLCSRCIAYKGYRAREEETHFRYLPAAAVTLKASFYTRVHSPTMIPLPIMERCYDWRRSNTCTLRFIQADVRSLTSDLKTEPLQPLVTHRSTGTCCKEITSTFYVTGIFKYHTQFIGCKQSMQHGYLRHKSTFHCFVGRDRLRCLIALLF